MTLDEALLAEVEAARDQLESLEDEAYDARARFHQAVRRLHAAGGSMREIATALAISHQRVHQIIGEDAIVEVEATSSEVTPHPAAASSVALTATEDACSFCGAPRRELDKLLAAPGRVFVCDGCVTRARREFRVQEDPARCSFCGNDRTTTYEENGTVICEPCVGVCERLLSTSTAGGDAARTAMRRTSPKLRCSFCNISSTDASRLIAGPNVYVCPACVTVALGVASTGTAAPGPRSSTLRPAVAESHPCSFCGRTTPSVAAMVKGGRARICDECLDVCDGILTAGP